VSAVERARLDAADGRSQLARQRLKNYLVNRSDDLDARAQLASYYRADGYLDEAGRWGYLGGATAHEIDAYEQQCAHRVNTGWTATYILRGLRWSSPLESAPAQVRTVLEALEQRAAAEEALWWQQAHPIGTAIKRVRERFSALLTQSTGRW